MNAPRQPNARSNTHPPDPAAIRNLSKPATVYPINLFHQLLQARKIQQLQPFLPGRQATQTMIQKNMIKMNTAQNHANTVIIGDYANKPNYDPEINFCKSRMLLSQAIKIIVEQREPAPYPKIQDTLIVSQTCPISRKPIIIPARGKDCTHRNCFDLRQFLLLIGDKPFSCPFCHLEITQEDLRFDPYFYSFDFKKESPDILTDMMYPSQIDVYTDGLKTEPSELSWL